MESSLRQYYQQARQSRDPRFDGKFFVAVKTTGIFCRPVCPARLPAEHNVTYYAHAAQALQHGYRPCLRCRPDSAPQSPAWRGVQSSVTRAQTLLSAIPPQSVAHIASRLGISERYLHKLITTHLGMSPKTYQNMQQVLFAKQLLQHSSTDVATIADAAGFNSARQLQRQLKQYCKMTPSALRRPLSKADADQGRAPVATLYLAYRPPYDWYQVRDFLRLRAITGIETVRDNSYCRQVTYPGGTGQITATHQPDKHRFKVELALSSLTHIYPLMTSVARILDTHADPVLIATSLSEAGLRQSQFSAGLRIPGVWSRFEGGCRAILGQQVSVKAAINKLSEFAACFDRQTPWGRAFPSPEQVAEDDLSWLAMPGARRKALRDFACLMAATPDADDNAVLAIPGIGPWTLHYLKMRADHDPDQYLATDLIVRKMASGLDLNPERATPWRSYLTVALWQLASAQT
ncbi:DNA-3-methyladenine glycosylase 2 family protein [Alteromonas halophila]|uniref:DNA-3-methyladenine glycosylase 2 family protein n=1 Tax=Alteromonas halophila TaxID=516698 RepID=UPI00167BD1EE|nr:Ada metal-binding domain-containing protein [Alteromonas halophila]